MSDQETQGGGRGWWGLGNEQKRRVGSKPQKEFEEFCPQRGFCSEFLVGSEEGKAIT